MMKHALSFFPIKMWPLAGLILFFVMFIFIVFWVNRKGSNELYDHVSRLPLKDSDDHAQGVPHV